MIQYPEDLPLLHLLPVERIPNLLYPELDRLPSDCCSLALDKCPRIHTTTSPSESHRCCLLFIGFVLSRFLGILMGNAAVGSYFLVRREKEVLLS